MKLITKLILPFLLLLAGCSGKTSSPEIPSVVPISGNDDNSTVIPPSINKEDESLEKVSKLVNNASPEIINNPKYPTKDVFVADVVLDLAHGFAIDNTGHHEIDTILQNTIDALYERGGGTIYLPHGTYKITTRIEVKPYINIRGDYVDPDKVTNGDYGTVINCCVRSTSEDVGAKSNVFRMMGSTALIGLTFFYPDQFLDIIAPYAYTIEIPGGLTLDSCTAYTLQDITFLNSYKGICASITNGSVTHEQLHLSNIKGTCLRVGAYLTNSSEVGTFDNITFSPKYWANASKKYNAPHIKTIIDFTTKNSVGMVLGDLEWQEITNVLIENYHTGLYFIDGTRSTSYHMAFIGQFYNLVVKNAQYGIYVTKLYENMGIDFCQSYVQGEKYAIMSSSPYNYGCLKISKSDIVGKTAGVNILYNNEKRTESEIKEWDNGDYNLPVLKLYDVYSDYEADVTGVKDASVAIQKALDDAHKNGGGVVYLRGGFYRLEKPLTVYANTQLRGCANALGQCQAGNSRGTFLLVHHSLGIENSEKAPAIITLDGYNSGVTGLRIGFPEFNLYEKKYTVTTIPTLPFAIRGTGANNYATNIYIPGAYNGVEMIGNNFIVKKVLGCFFNVGYSLSGDHGLLTGGLSNGACTLKPGSDKIDDFKAWGNISYRLTVLQSYIYDLTRGKTTLIKADDCIDLNVNHVFTFGTRTFIQATNSEIEFYNVGFDSQPVLQGAMFDLNNTKAIVFNMLRDNCATDHEQVFIKSQGDSNITIYNIILLLQANAGRFKGNIINNEKVSLTELAGDSPVNLEKIWKASINYTYVDYSK